jgi:hypothetical protein
MLVGIKNTLALLALPLIVACSSGPALEQQPTGEFAAQGLHPVTRSGFAQAYAKPGTQLTRYSGVAIATLSTSAIETGHTTVDGTLRRDWQMNPERELALQQVWASAMQRAFNSYDQSGDGAMVLEIKAAITRVAPGRPTATTLGGGMQSMASSQDVVEIFMEFRLYDKASSELLVVIRDSRTMISQAMSRTAPAGIQMMFNSWAALLHTRVSGR